MFIAHLPSGYLATRWLSRRVCSTPVIPKVLLLVGLIGAVCPDFDLLYFYFVDNREHNHHSYWSHFPVTWLVVLLSAVALCRVTDFSRAAIFFLAFALGGVLHMVLDTFVGGIQWLAPFYDDYFSVGHVSARHQPWWLNFILHWSMLIELLIVLWAGRRAYQDWKAGMLVLSAKGQSGVFGTNGRPSL